MLRNVVVVFATITFFSCEGNYKNVQKLIQEDGLPAGEGLGIKMVYTDSGRVVSTMDTQKLLNYGNMDFGYEEFPEGVEVNFYENGEKSTVTSEYAVRYPLTGIVDLRKNVVLVTSDGNVLNAEQLYWDQNNKWVFTDKPYRITFNDGSYNDGARFDANEDFTVFLSRKNDGIQMIDQNQKPDEQ